MRQMIERKGFARIPVVMDPPDLVELQKHSYDEFLQEKMHPDKRRQQGLEAVFREIFPITSDDGKCSFEFLNYSIEKPGYTIEDCQQIGMTYAAPLKARMRLVLHDKGGEDKDIRKQEVYLGEIPLMSENGSFIINGVERVVVGQLHRSPGVFYDEKVHSSGKRLYSAKIIPHRGGWIEFEFDRHGLLWVTIDRGRRVLATTFLRAFGYSSDEEIIKLFYDIEMVKLGATLQENQKIIGRLLAESVIIREGASVPLGTELNAEILAEIAKERTNLRLIILTKEGKSIIDTLKMDHCCTREEALIEIYQRLRPGEPTTTESASRYFQRLFFSSNYYSLGRVGRHRLNQRLGTNVSENMTSLRKEDLAGILRYLLKLESGDNSVDDIDHLGNRRLRLVGELVEAQFRIALARMERNIREKMNSRELTDLWPRNMINFKVVSSVLKDFFGRSQLSQFMDQINPLAELTHKRRISALGPGGLSRERAGFEARDIHFSHYGRICPVETPEGLNIGLIVSLSTYARTNKYGFLETPYRKVKDRKVTNEIAWLSADVEDNYFIAQINTELDEQGRLKDEEVFARFRDDFIMKPAHEIEYMDVSPLQLVSVSAGLIPFLEHDDANRALMGSNMQRQAVSLLRTEAPLVGTGLESTVARDAGATVIARTAGRVERVIADEIIIRGRSGTRKYPLQKFYRSNQNISLNQKPLTYPGDLVKAGEIIADGPATSGGELALGKNVLVAFMPWRGYNFEDAILISEKIVKDDIYTSIHIEEFEVEERDTRLGPEEITRDIPNVSEDTLGNLDENGIVRIGAEVNPGDILVGKVAPRGETELLPEDRLLRAIFGEKAGDVRDASLKVPPGGGGTVINVRVFSRQSGALNTTTLSSGVNKVAKVYIAVKQKLQVGDKLSGRHGNKGVVSCILPEEDMPYLPDGTPVEIVINPLGVPSRMTLGQILEAHLGWAAHAMGIYVSSPVFDGAKEKDIKDLLCSAGLPENGTTTLYDGYTGEPFTNKITVGYIYIMKLNHLVDEKVHARATGPYSLITQQPLGGKAQLGGQRFGEMEVWALEGYGAAHILQELLTVKSDDVAGRARMYESIVKGENAFPPSTPESFNVLTRELQSLCLDIRYEEKVGEKVFLSRRDTGNISIGIASPEAIFSWSRGEVKKPETINYRTFKPEKDGLFCEKIFGPAHDWECHCGKYKRIKHKGIICDYCGVEVTRSEVRRERMGHIKLACPVVHIWFFRIVPSRIGAILEMSMRDLEKVIYYEKYVVIDPGDSGLKKGTLLMEEERWLYQKQFGSCFKAEIGAEAIRELLEMVSLDELVATLRAGLEKATSSSAQLRIMKRLRIVEGFRQSDNKLGWMVMDVIPVLPPDLRPLIPLDDGGRFATSDLNDLYRRILNRNSRLRKLLQDPVTPGIIIRNEKRMLQEAVDALFDNGCRGKPIVRAGNRPLKSLSDVLKGKGGRFRQNLLGKRADYSGRSVVVVNPKLKFSQCGLPRRMALELFEPFILEKLRERGLAHTIRGAKRTFEKIGHEIWKILEEVVKDHMVLLNRAPTLHRLGIQAFQPTLVEGNAIHIHPLVCTAFNADFDGDQMAVHIPLSTEAQMEAYLLMLSSRNVLSPASGEPIAVPTQDIVLGCYYLTKERAGAKGEGKIFSDPGEVEIAWRNGYVDIQAMIKICRGRKLVTTTVGRVIFNTLLPPLIPFVNQELKKSDLSHLIGIVHRQCGAEEAVQLLDSIKDIGFEVVTTAGISIAIDDSVIPPAKNSILKEAKGKVNEIKEQYHRGLITNGERHNRIIDLWTRCTDKISNLVFEQMEKSSKDGQFNSIFMMADSGARGSRLQIRQLGGMRGLMAKSSGEIIETPITANFREGLTALEYFLSTHGGRKGLADTALKTADSGYLTRRLVDVAQDLIITEEDCGTPNGIEVEAIYGGMEELVSLGKRVVGRIACDDIIIPQLGNIIVKNRDEITEELADVIEEAGIERVKVRSPLTCETRQGICRRCYGRNLSTGHLVELGEAVGVIAAQSIGEPGTQLTMRTFHVGGAAQRVIEQSAAFARDDGVVHYYRLKTIKNKEQQTIVLNRNGAILICNKEGGELERHIVLPGAVIACESGVSVAKGDLLASWDPYMRPILSEIEGNVEFEDIVLGVTVQEEFDRATGLTTKVITEHKADLHPQIVIRDASKQILGYYGLPPRACIVVRERDRVSPGDLLSKTPREVAGTVDITGGLPRIVELFEARRPKNPAVITEIDGIVEFTESVGEKRKIIVKNEETGMKREYLVPPGKHMTIYKGEMVSAGQPLTDGPVVLQDILRVRGIKNLQRHLIDQIQEIYWLQGVTINDKHIELIIRQMLRRIEIENKGDTAFLIGDQIDRWKFEEENEKLKTEGKRPARAAPVILGITRASLSTDSFIAAASFQETTRVLTDAAFNGRKDELKSLKENVVLGRLIPAGTGMSHHYHIAIDADVKSIN
ncbi:DNA-directed RNA polymerase subunit beta' [candidate division NPL-UPA2 bacterium Unc8]|uniref:Multifunctional fusion protein n=1 Tax=candidate division NPL-UPA2 bacterium Unc8 TaxID=1980939 RepID=A0A399FY17_UNCN2|nr:DNA-directed RNA polymerase subunit beta' [Bacillota bacterium]MBT9146484.1 DNA-directed RNA polymerase subunit beta' [Bacillota bacterium]RII00309.1 MAG: DNA-directed RNA polymerase subunit beta' [candidate division NPL-UPA2 bacterium Unc8]